MQTLIIRAIKKEFGNQVNYSIDGTLAYRAAGEDIIRALEMANLFPNVKQIKMIDSNYPEVPPLASLDQTRLGLWLWRLIDRRWSTEQRKDKFDKLVTHLSSEAKRRDWTAISADISSNGAVIHLKFKFSERLLDVVLVTEDARRYQPSHPHAVSLVSLPGISGRLGKSQRFWRRVAEDTETLGLIIVERAVMPNSVRRNLKSLGMQLVHSRETPYPYGPGSGMNLSFVRGPIVFQKISGTKTVFKKSHFLFRKSWPNSILKKSA